MPADYAEILTTDSWVSGSLHCHILPSGQINYQVNGWSATPASTARLTTGTWYHVALVFDGSVGKIYVNGAQDTSISVGATAANLTAVKLGTWQGTSRFLNGKFDDYRVLGRAMSASEVASLFAAGGSDTVSYHRFDEASGTSAYDSSGHGKTGTLTNGPTWVTGKTGNGVNLDGTNGYVSLPNGLVSSLTNFSIVTWVKLDANNTWNRIFDFGTGSSYYMFLTGNAGSVVRYAIKAGGGEQQINSTSALTTGAWHQVAVTQSGTTGTLYVDGAQAGQNTGMTLNPSSLGSTTQTWIGRSQFADPYLDGIIDGFRIYNRALTGTEISTLFGGGAGAASVPSMSVFGDPEDSVVIPAR